MRKSYNLIHEDQDIIVLDKSGHVLTIEDRFDPTRKNLKSMMVNRFGEIYVVHRLDFETSGVIIFARNPEAHKSLQEQFSNRTVTKIYHALTRTPSEEKGSIDDNIGESKSERGTYKVDKEGKRALTRYEVIENLGRYSLLELQIFTGRTHQIRVHLKSIGAPLLTDKKYGQFQEFYLSQIKKIRINRDQEERPLLQRSSLHAYQLTFVHPQTKKEVTFQSDYHKDMRATLFQLRKLIN